MKGRILELEAKLLAMKVAYGLQPSTRQKDELLALDSLIEAVNDCHDARRETDPRAKALALKWMRIHARAWRVMTQRLARPIVTQTILTLKPAARPRVPALKFSDFRRQTEVAT